MRLVAFVPAALAFVLAAAAPDVLAHQGENEATSVQLPALGALSFPTSTKNPEAQRAFIEGMLWLHLFEYDHAKDSFIKAQSLDPGFAMAYWGEAMTYTHALWNQDKPDLARAALAKLAPTPEARAAKAPTAREKAFMAAVEKLYAQAPLKERDAGFRDAMKDVAAAYPQDDEAALFYALWLMGASRGERDVPAYLQAAGIARKVFEHNPQHPGAAHYWIHGMDDPEHAREALIPARALSKIAPAAGHAQHMTSHIFMALGMWEDVETANVNAIAVVDAENRKNGQPVTHCGHYAEWLQYAYYQLGKADKGEVLLQQCRDQTAAALAFYAAHPEVRTPGGRPLPALKKRLDESLVNMRATAVVESLVNRQANAQWPLDVSDVGSAAAWDAFAQAFAAADARDFDAAHAALDKLQAEMQKPMGEEDTPDTHVLMQVLEKLSKSMIAGNQGQLDQAIALAREAGALQDALPFDFGPPVSVKPPHELAGEWLLQAGKASEAAQEFERALKTAPGRRLPRQGLEKAQALQKHPA